MNRTFSRMSLTEASALVVTPATGCGGSSREAAPARAPAAEPAYAAPAPATEESDAAKEAPSSSAPAGAGAPAAQSTAPLPGSTKGESRNGAADDLEALGRSLERALRLSVPDCPTPWAPRARIRD